MRSGRLTPATAQCRGITVVEILLGLGLTLLVGLAAVQHLMVARNANRAVNVHTDAQHEANMALELILGEIRRAGYRVDALADPEEAFGVQSFSFGDPPVTTTLPPGVATYVGPREDIWLRFQASGDRWDADCLGSVSTRSGFVVVQRIWVDAGGLNCGVWREQSFESRVLLEGVEAWSVAAAVDDDGDGNADRYAGPSHVADWSTALGLSVKLRTASPEPDPNSRPQSYVDMDGTVRAAPDRRLRRLASGVALLAGRLP